MLRLILTLGLLAGADAGFGRKKEKDGASRMEEELNAEAEQNREAPVGNAREWEVENAARYKTGELNTAELGLKNMQQAMKDPSVMAETMKMMQDPEIVAKARQMAQSMGLSGGGMGGGGGVEAELARLRAENNMLKAKAEL